MGNVRGGLWYVAAGSEGLGPLHLAATGPISFDATSEVEIHRVLIHSDNSFSELMCEASQEFETSGGYHQNKL